MRTCGSLRPSLGGSLGVLPSQAVVAQHVEVDLLVTEVQRGLRGVQVPEEVVSELRLQAQVAQPCSVAVITHTSCRSRRCGRDALVALHERRHAFLAPARCSGGALVDVHGLRGDAERFAFRYRGGGVRGGMLESRAWGIRFTPCAVVVGGSDGVWRGARSGGVALLVVGRGGEGAAQLVLVDLLVQVRDHL